MQFLSKTLFPFPLVTAKLWGDNFDIKGCGAKNDAIPGSMAMWIEFAAQIMKQFWTCGFFSSWDRISFQAPKIRCAIILTFFLVGRSCLSRIAYCQRNRLLILLERVEREIRFSMANGMFKMKMDINCHGPRLMSNNCQHLDPPYFSLPTIFNYKIFLL
jgi:hypothetical protein